MAEATLTEAPLTRHLLNSNFTTKASAAMGFGSTVGFKTLSTKKIFVGYETHAYGWTGFAVGFPHNGAGVVRNQGGKVDVVTQVGKPPVFTPGSRFKFERVKGGKKGSKLWATFVLPMDSDSLQVTLAAGAAKMQKHATTPRKYTLYKKGLRLK